MSAIILGVGDMLVTNEPDATIKTVALGSCVALVIHDPENKLVGVAHVALPDSSLNKKRAEETPGFFADSAIPKLLSDLKRRNSSASAASLKVALVGGARVIKSLPAFDIGKRTVSAVKNVLRNMGYSPSVEDVGGAVSRTMTFCCQSGRITVSSPGRDDWRL